QQLGDRELADPAAGLYLGPQRQGVGDHQLVELGAFDIADRRTRQHRVHTVRHHLAGAALLQCRGSRVQGAGGVDDDVDHHAGLAFDVTDDVHHGGHVGTRPTLVDDRQVGVVQPFGDRPRAHHATHVGTDHDQVFHAVAAPDVGQQHWRGIHVVDRDVEETLDLVG